ncbi:hypothetical protein E1B28_008342 [Marasmius oreades]|uniref:Uncharacterized protein n=1 Tax=Marasmius oreades TaxID=181124 RepID=A0A9P7URN6_9AGAR|nr:uncharacterized protein E1B28_008342 [Marasmius oreades]KAG7091952.1 hypothetical protein E1B28_008342 [Marasmius oreades]
MLKPGFPSSPKSSFKDMLVRVNARHQFAKQYIAQNGPTAQESMKKLWMGMSRKERQVSRAVHGLTFRSSRRSNSAARRKWYEGNGETSGRRGGKERGERNKCRYYVEERTEMRHAFGLVRTREMIRNRTGSTSSPEMMPLFLEVTSPSMEVLARIPLYRRCT